MSNTPKKSIEENDKFGPSTNANNTNTNTNSASYASSPLGVGMGMGMAMGVPPMISRHHSINDTFLSHNNNNNQSNSSNNNNNNINGLRSSLVNDMDRLHLTGRSQSVSSVYQGHPHHPNNNMTYPSSSFNSSEVGVGVGHTGSNINASPMSSPISRPQPIYNMNMTSSPHRISTTSLLPRSAMNINNNDPTTTTTTTSSSSSSTTTMPPTPQTSNSTTDITSIIHDAARITDWKSVNQLSQSHPQSAFYKCQDGLTPLHHACSRRCPYPHVFQNLIQANPNALIEIDEKGWTPLHYACRFKAPKEGVRLLLHSYLDYGVYAAQLKCKEKGRTPLYYAIRYEAPEGVVELLLNCMEKCHVLDTDREQRSVLSLIWDDYVNSIEGKRILKYYTDHLKKKKKKSKKKEEEKGNDNGNTNEEEEEEDDLEYWIKKSKMLRHTLKTKHKKLYQSWNRANMILKGAFQFKLDDDGHDNGDDSNGDNNGHDNDDKNDKQGVKQDNNLNENATATKKKRKWRVLHAAVSIRCNYKLVQMACVLHPEQAREIDQHDLFGSTTSSSSSSSSANNNHTNTAAATTTTTRQVPDQFTALQLASKSPMSGKDSRMTFTHLLELYPAAATVPNPSDQSLPLHYICGNEYKSHWNDDGIHLVYQANTQAVLMQDANGRTPLHRACSISEPTTTTSFKGASSSLTTATSASVVLPSSIHPSSSSSSITPSLRSLTTSTTSASTINDSLVIPSSSSMRANGAAAAAGATTMSNGNNSNHVISATATNNNNIFASSLEPDGSIIQNIVSNHPEVASTPDNQGKLPFHSIAEFGESWDVNVQSLYDAYPQVLTRRTSPTTATTTGGGNGGSNLPIHLACKNPDAKSCLLEKIVEYHPRCASLVNGEGKLPFHLACESGKSWFITSENHNDDDDDTNHTNNENVADDTTGGGVLECIYNAFPNAVRIPEANERGWTALHFIVTCPYSSKNDIEQILDLYPNAASILDGSNKMPLHLAVESGKEWDNGIDLMFKANPEAIQIEDDLGRVPFVAALLTFCDGKSKSQDNAENLKCEEAQEGKTDEGNDQANDNKIDCKISATEKVASTVGLPQCTLDNDNVKLAGVAATAATLSNPNDDSNLMGPHLAQVNVIYHLLKAAPHLLKRR